MQSKLLKEGTGTWAEWRRLGARACLDSAAKISAGKRQAWKRRGGPPQRAGNLQVMWIEEIGMGALFVVRDMHNSLVIVLILRRMSTLCSLFLHCLRIMSTMYHYM